MEETSPNHFEARPPLHHPALYDDVEVPNLFKIDGEYYLVGNMREDAKIRYWHTNQIGKPWRSYADNVLLATGNYAGRISHDERGILLWSFFTPDGHDRMSNNFMPPPKRLVRTEKGHLQVRSFEAFESQIDRVAKIESFAHLKQSNESVVWESDSTTTKLACQCGFQIFASNTSSRQFSLTSTWPTAEYSPQCSCSTD
jgi:beta-fructofuranosidase